MAGFNSWDKTLHERFTKPLIWDRVESGKASVETWLKKAGHPESSRAGDCGPSGAAVERSAGVAGSLSRKPAQSRVWPRKVWT